MSETPTHYSYRGRRLFQTAIALLGALILSLGIYDLSLGVNRTPIEERYKDDDAFGRLNKFTDQIFGQRTVDFLIMAIGGWILFFGLDAARRRGPQLRFGPEGLNYFRFGAQTIPWDAFERINFIPRRRMALLRAAHIDLKLKDPEPVARAQPIPYRLFRRTVHMTDQTMFTIHGYDIDAPLIRVLGEMQAIAEPELAALERAETEETPDDTAPEV